MKYFFLSPIAASEYSISNFRNFFIEKFIDVSGSGPGPTDIKLIVFFLLVSLSIFFFVVFFREELRKIVEELLLSVMDFRDSFFSLDKKTLIILSVLVTAGFSLKVFLAFSFPIDYDEAYTYFFFTRHGFLRSLTHYPAPNNHILHSILTSITYYFPFNETMNLRMPSILIGTLTVLVFFYVFSKLTNKKVALFTTAFFSFLYPVVYYGFSSRGYALVLLAFLISFYAVIRILRNFHEKDSSRKYFFIFIVSAISGFFAMPSFLYPFLSLISFLSISFIASNCKKDGKSLLLSVLVVVISVMILYTPVFLVSGVHAVTNNPFVAPMAQKDVLLEVIPHFLETFEYLFSVDAIVLGVALFIISGFLFGKRHRVKEVLLVLYILLFCPIIILIHSVIPFSRTWIYLIIPCLYVVGIFLEKMDSKSLKIAYLVGTIPFGLLLLNFPEEVKTRNAMSITAGEIGRCLYLQEPKNVLVRHPLLGINLAYYNDMRGGNMNIYKQYDTFEREYDFVVANKNDDLPEEYIRMYIFEENIAIYKRLNFSKTRKSP